MTNKFGHWILLSGSGIGAGKTTLARKFAGIPTLSLAGALRQDLYDIYPTVEWNNRTQEYKASRPAELAGLSVREMLVKFGQDRCNQDPVYWPKRLMTQVSQTAYGNFTAVVDDLRKVIELDYFRHHGKSVVHFHIHHETATPEPQYDSDWLFDVADYVLMRRTE